MNHIESNLKRALKEEAIVEKIRIEKGKEVLISIQAEKSKKKTGPNKSNKKKTLRSKMKKNIMIKDDLL